MCLQSNNLISTAPTYNCLVGLLNIHGIVVDQVTYFVAGIRLIRVDSQAKPPKRNNYLNHEVVSRLESF